MADCAVAQNFSSKLTDEYEFCDRSQRLFVATLFVILSLLGAFGNTLVILAVALCGKLRSTTNIFVTNLSVADLITCCMFSGHAVAMASPAGWPLPDWICSVVSAATIICLGCSIFNLAFIALNRLLLITQPIATYRHVYSKYRLIAMVVCSWLVPAIVTLFPPFFGLVSIGYDNKHKVCTTDHSNINSNVYDLILASVYYPIPFLVLSSSYLKIYLHVKRHIKRMDLTLSSTYSVQNGAPNGSRVGTPTGTPDGTLKSRNFKTSAVANNKKNRLHMEITKNTFMVVCAFVLLTTPFTFCVVMDFCDVILPYLGILLIISSCVNPLIYATRHQHFKRVFRCILCCRFDDIPHPPAWLKKLLRGSTSAKNSWNSTASITDDNMG